MVVSRMYPLVIGSLVLSVASSVAQEKKIKRSDLPAAVEKTVAAQSQRATIRGFSEERENGQMCGDFAPQRVAVYVRDKNS